MAAKNSAASHSGASTQRELDLVLNKEYQHVFRAQDYFSVDISTGHVFDVVSGKGIMRSNVRGDKLVETIKVG